MRKYEIHFYKILKHTVAVVMNSQHDFVVYKLVETALDTTAERELEKLVEVVEMVIDIVEKSFETVQNTEALVDMADVVVVVVAAVVAVVFVQEDDVDKMISNS